MRIFIISVSFLVSATSFSAMPNGLCLLMNKTGGFGHGFVVDNRVISNAHVLKQADGKKYCLQDGEWVELDSDSLSVPNYHDRFKSENLVDRLMSDLAFVEIGQKLKSDFELPDYLNYEGLEELEESGVLTKEHSFFHIDDLRKVSINSSHRLLIPWFIRDIEGVLSEISYQPGFIWPDSGEAAEVNSYFDFALPLKPGHSGTPLFHTNIHTGKFVILGVVRGDLKGFDFSDVVINHLRSAGAIREYPVTVIPIFYLNRWLHSQNSRASLTCKSFLSF